MSIVRRREWNEQCLLLLLLLFLPLLLQLVLLAPPLLLLSMLLLLLLLPVPGLSAVLVAGKGWEAEEGLHGARCCGRCGHLCLCCCCCCCCSR